MKPCFDCQEQSALVSVASNSTDLSLSAGMLMDIVSHSFFSPSNNRSLQAIIMERNKRRVKRNEKLFTVAEGLVGGEGLKATTL